MSVTVITATLPERHQFLERAITSVRRQTLLPQAHLIGYDYARRGGAAVKNDLAYAAESKWVAILDDDDYFYPDHLAALVEAAETSGSDVAYSWCDVTGANPWLEYNQPFDAGRLRQLSIVSHNALVRTELFVELGGFKPVKGYDWLLWVAALNTGAKFTCVERKTWHYDLSETHQHESRP
jgi:glycosyltransferase involved in cell wall biosynthesis